MFFETMKKEIRKSNIILLLIALAFLCAFAVATVFTGFSSEKEYQIGFRYTKLGIPIPNWLLSVIFILICLACVYRLVLLLKDIVKNTTYNETIAKAEKLGNIEVIDSILGSLPKNEHTKGGDLIFNDMLFFYRNGTDITLAATNQIMSVVPNIQKGREQAIYVQVQFPDETLKINAREKDVLTLAEEILICAKASRIENYTNVSR